MLQKGKFEQVYVCRTSEITVYYLRDVIKRMVNQREYIITNFSSHRDASRLRAITRVRNMMEVVKGKNMMAHCNMIQTLEEPLTMLLPSPSSRFYPHVNNQIADILSYAKKYTEQK